MGTATLSNGGEIDRRYKDREYLFDMLNQLAALAKRCNERQVAYVLSAMAKEGRSREPKAPSGEVPKP